LARESSWWRCLAAGLTYRASVSLVPAGIAEDGFVLGLAALLLVLAMLARRSESLARYWEIPFALFVFTVAGFFGDGTTSTNNPLASAVAGSVLAQLFGTLILGIPIIALDHGLRGQPALHLHRQADQLVGSRGGGARFRGDLLPRRPRPD